MTEPTPEAFALATSFGPYATPETIRIRAERIDAFASRRVAEKDAEIATLRQGIDTLNGLIAGKDQRYVEMRDEIAALRAQVEWRPISEAPKGQEVLGGWMFKDKWIIAVVKSPNGGGWFSVPGTWTYYPTHFRPLPVPPDHTAPSKGDAE